MEGTLRIQVIHVDGTRMIDCTRYWWVVKRTDDRRRYVRKRNDVICDYKPERYATVRKYNRVDKLFVGTRKQSTPDTGGLVQKRSRKYWSVYQL